MNLSKSAMRKKVLSKRNALTAHSIKKLSSSIQLRVIKSSLFMSANVVGAYHAVGSEVRTGIIIDEAIRLGKIVCLPRVGGRRISFHEYATEAGLAKGKFGIMEPAREARLASPDILIVPGAAFDRDGYRIGYGKGYYDRYLSESPTTSIGVAYSFQVVERIPRRSHDRRVNVLVTENELIIPGA